MSIGNDNNYCFCFCKGDRGRADKCIRHRGFGSLVSWRWPGFCLRPGGVWGCGWGSSLKNGVFLNVPFSREAANAAELLAGSGPLGRFPFVRQAAKGGIIPAERSIKKHHHFFTWSRKHIPRQRRRGGNHMRQGGNMGRMRLYWRLRMKGKGIK